MRAPAYALIFRSSIGVVRDAVAEVVGREEDAGVGGVWQENGDVGRE